MNTGTSAPPDRGGTLLLNWVFYNPVGMSPKGTTSGR